jgi:transposase
MGTACVQQRRYLGAPLRAVGARAWGESFRLDDESGDPQARLELQKKSVGASERDEKERSAWRSRLSKLDPHKLVFVDESGTNISLTTLYARAPKGERSYGKAPRNWGKNLTLIASLSLEGLSQQNMVVEGATDTKAFESYVEHFLCPELKAGQVVIMDNLSAHKGERICTLIESKGAHLLFMPAYSPDFNPIEGAFSKIKNSLRKAKARTRESLLEAIGLALDEVTHHDAQGWFGHCGYGIPVS